MAAKQPRRFISARRRIRRLIFAASVCLPRSSPSVHKIRSRKKLSFLTSPGLRTVKPPSSCPICLRTSPSTSRSKTWRCRRTAPTASVVGSTNARRAATIPCSYGKERHRRALVLRTRGGQLQYHALTGRNDTGATTPAQGIDTHEPENHQDGSGQVFERVGSEAGLR